MSPLQQDPANLSSQRDIIEPGAISLWPLAPGWWVVIGIVLALSGLLVWRALDKYRRNAYRRAAISELATINNDLARLPALLKRTALGAFPRTQVASLSGEEWLRFLDSSGSTTNFTDGPGREIVALAYTANALPEDQQLALLACAEQWIRGHKQAAT